MMVILLQQGKGGDIANAFGGGGSQAVFGARAGATLLTKVTSGLAVTFMLVALILAVWGEQGPSSVVGGVEGPAAPQLPPSALPGCGARHAQRRLPATTPPPSQPAPAPAGEPATPPGEAPPPKNSRPTDPRHWPSAGTIE